MTGRQRLGAMSIVVVIAACTGQRAPASSSVSHAPSASPSSAPTPSPTSTPGTAAPPSAPLPSAPLPSAPPPIAAPTVVPDETPKLAGTGWADDPPEPILLNQAVRVDVAELTLREGPSTGAKPVASMPLNTVLAVGRFPAVEVDGYTWYAGVVLRSVDGKLPPLTGSGALIDPPTGWFAATNGSTAYVEALPPRCASSIDVQGIEGMLEAELLACFAGRTIEFDATYGCRGCTPDAIGVVHGDFEPAWLADPNVINVIRPVGSGDYGVEGIGVRFRPSGPPAPAEGSIIRVRGHLNDPVSIDCSVSIAPPWLGTPLSTPQSFSTMWCRQMFVVESYDVMGTDPAFPTE